LTLVARTSDSLIREAAELVRAHGSISKAAKASGIPFETLRKRLHYAERDAAEAVDKDAPAYKRDNVRLQDENARLRNEIKQLHRDNLTAEEVRKTIFGLTEVSPKPPVWLLSGPSKSGVTGVPRTMWSDWHLGEVVSLAETNGVNEYNLQIAQDRIIRLVERTIDLCFHHMTNPKYPGIVVDLIGDIVSGDIHDELRETNETDLLPVVLWAVDRLIWALRTLADKFGRVYVVCVPGNHGRLTKKPHAKRYVYKNADWLIYNLLERHFKAVGDTRVDFYIPASGDALTRIFDVRYMSVHGDDLGVKGGDGIIGSIGPIMRGEIKVHGSSAQIGRDYDFLNMGHWHQELWLPRANVNNTLKGYDEYARRMLRAPASEPAQSLWFTHPSRGITARWGVRLDNSKKSNPNSEWIQCFKTPV
jgi:hypothetical protein